MPVLVDEGEGILKKYYTFAEVADMFHTTPHTLRKWIKEKNVDSYQLGRMRLFPPEEIKKLVHGGKDAGQSE